MSTATRVRLADVLAAIEPRVRQPQLTRIWAGVAERLDTRDVPALLEMMLDARIPHTQITRILRGAGIETSHTSVATCRKALRRHGCPLLVDTSTAVR